MGNRKKARRGRGVWIDDAILKSLKWISLSSYARDAFVALRQGWFLDDDGEECYKAPYSTWCPHLQCRARFHKSLEELLEAGFFELKRAGKLIPGVTRRAAVYRECVNWQRPATTTLKTKNPKRPPKRNKWGRFSSGHRVEVQLPSQVPARSTKNNREPVATSGNVPAYAMDRSRSMRWTGESQSPVERGNLRPVVQDEDSTCTSSSVMRYELSVSFST